VTKREARPLWHGFLRHAAVGGKPVAFIGPHRAASAPSSARTLGSPFCARLVELWSEGRILVPRAQGVFDEAGTLTDTAVKEHLSDFLRRFVAFVGLPKH
jgi:chromate reductase, NAD(P)H dehydrogenase (quinone)